jgi:hypothetical protein
VETLVMLSALAHGARSGWWRNAILDFGAAAHMTLDIASTAFLRADRFIL